MSLLNEIEVRAKWNGAFSQEWATIKHHISRDGSLESFPGRTDLQKLRAWADSQDLLMEFDCESEGFSSNIRSITFRNGSRQARDGQSAGSNTAEEQPSPQNGEDVLLHGTTAVDSASECVIHEDFDWDYVGKGEQGDEEAWASLASDVDCLVIRSIGESLPPQDTANTQLALVGDASALAETLDVIDPTAVQDTENINEAAANVEGANVEISDAGESDTLQEAANTEVSCTEEEETTARILEASKPLPPQGAATTEDVDVRGEAGGVMSPAVSEPNPPQVSVNPKDTAANEPIPGTLPSSEMKLPESTIESSRPDVPQQGQRPPQPSNTVSSRTDTEPARGGQRFADYAKGLAVLTKGLRTGQRAAQRLAQDVRRIAENRLLPAAKRLQNQIVPVSQHAIRWLHTHWRGKEWTEVALRWSGEWTNVALRWSKKWARIALQWSRERSENLLQWSKEWIQEIANPSRRALVLGKLQEFGRYVLDQLSSLRRVLAHRVIPQLIQWVNHVRTTVRQCRERSLQNTRTTEQANSSDSDETPTVSGVRELDLAQDSQTTAVTAAKVDGEKIIISNLCEAGPSADTAAAVVAEAAEVGPKLHPLAVPEPVLLDENGTTKETAAKADGGLVVTPPISEAGGSTDTGSAAHVDAVDNVAQAAPSDADLQTEGAKRKPERRGRSGPASGVARRITKRPELRSSNPISRSTRGGRKRGSTISPPPPSLGDSSEPRAVRRIRKATRKATIPELATRAPRRTTKARPANSSAAPQVSVDLHEPESAVKVTE